VYVPACTYWYVGVDWLLVLLSPKLHKYVESDELNGDRLKVIVEPIQILCVLGIIAHDCAFNAQLKTNKNNMAITKCFKGIKINNIILNILLITELILI
jgi:hypothetical protein